MVLARIPVAGVSALILAFVVAAYLDHAGFAAVFLWWLPTKVAVGAARIVHAWRVVKRIGASAPVPAVDKHLMHALMFLDGLLWGLAGVFFTDASHPHALAVVVCSLVGIACSGAFTLHADRRSMLLYTAPILVPSSLALVLHGGIDMAIFGIGTLVLQLGLFALSRKGQRQLHELLRLRFVTDQLAREAERQNAQKTKFLATMTHELRTPLHGVLGLTDLALTFSRQDNVNALLSRARQSGQHLLSLINAILDLSAIESGRIHLSRQDFAPRALIEEVLAVAQVSADRKGLEITRMLDVPQDCAVVSDPTRLREILHNLLGNAIKFTETGGVHVHARWLPSADPDTGTLDIAVSDSGPGIPAERVDSIFDPYVRLDTAPGAQLPSSGTGLGLTITRELARAMGGDVRCTSTVGQGTTFTLTLELGRGSIAAVQPLAAMPPSTRGVSTLADVVHGRVLLAEDNEVNAIVAEAILKELGLSIEIVGDGAAAVDRLRAAGDEPHIDLVLMDCQMPVMDGFTATRRIREHEDSLGLPHVPVIALTANAMAGDEANCLAAGMDGYLSKPFDRTRLLAVLRPLLSRTPQPQSSR